ncbi:hypothetical protein TNCV_1318861 [Trichonephila clavipes]|nr:hypothetical protein TNCV_1318861 [Trichonephila clavipes]
MCVKFFNACLISNCWCLNVLLLLLIPHDQQCQIEVHEIHHGDSTFWLVSTPILRGDTLGGIRSTPRLFPFHQSLERTCGLMARVPPCRKDTIRLQTSIPFPGLEPRPYSTVVNVTNRYTGWVAA